MKIIKKTRNVVKENAKIANCLQKKIKNKKKRITKKKETKIQILCQDVISFVSRFI